MKRSALLSGLRKYYRERTNEEAGEIIRAAEYALRALAQVRTIKYSAPMDNHGHLMRPKTRIVKFLISQ